MSSPMIHQQRHCGGSVISGQERGVTLLSEAPLYGAVSKPNVAVSALRGGSFLAPLDKAVSGKIGLWASVWQGSSASQKIK